jgi:hypothetical protein
MRLMITILLLCTVALVARAADDNAKKSAAVKEPALQSELIRRFKADQVARQTLVDWLKQNGTPGDFEGDKLGGEKKAEFKKLADVVTKADTENAAWLKEVIAKHGWPSFSMVGKEGAIDAWLLVQHADADPKFQRQCLDLMTKHPNGEVQPSNVALLTDRVLLAEGKKQIYGTQFEFTDGKPMVLNLDDPANVDKRRAEVGLEPLEKYLEDSAKFYGANPAK